MQIFVKPQTGKTVALEVEPNATVASVKYMLALREGVPRTNQRLIFGLRWLEDNETLAGCGVKSESLLLLVRTFPNIEINVRIIAMDQTCAKALIVDQYDLVSDVKLKIQTELGVDSSLQILNFQDEVLDNHNSLLHYAIQQDSKLDLSFLPMKVSVMHPRGGSPVCLICWPIHTIDDIKAKFKNAFGLQPIEMRLVYNGLDLSDGRRTLGNYNIPPGAVLKCKTVSAVWTSSNFLLSLVATWLELKDVVKLMSVLNRSRGLVGSEVVVAPSDELVVKMIGRALRKDVKIDARSLRWKHCSLAQGNHSQLASLPELRMLHHLLKVVPEDMQLVSGLSALNEVGKQYGASVCVLRPRPSLEGWSRACCLLQSRRRAWVSSSRCRASAAWQMSARASSSEPAQPATRSAALARARVTRRSAKAARKTSAPAALFSMRQRKSRTVRRCARSAASSASPALAR